MLVKADFILAEHRAFFTLLSVIAIAYLKTIKYIKIFAHAQTRIARKKERKFGKNVFFRICAYLLAGRFS